MSEAREEVVRLFSAIDQSLKADETGPAIVHLRQVVERLSQRTLPEELHCQIVKQPLVKATVALLRCRDLEEDESAMVSEVLEDILRLGVQDVRDRKLDIIDVVSRILTDNMPFYQVDARGGIDGGDLDTDESTEDSQSDLDGSDVEIPAPGDGEITSGFDGRRTAYVRKVNAFHEAGGFNALMEQLRAADPRPSLVMARFLLRPFHKVRAQLKKRVLVHFATEVRDVVEGLVLGMTDEELKQQDHKAVHDILRVVEALTAAADIPDAVIRADQLVLDFGLKCLRSPYLGKRLAGLAEIKEIIHGCARKHEMQMAMVQGMEAGAPSMANGVGGHAHPNQASPVVLTGTPMDVGAAGDVAQGAVVQAPRDNWLDVHAVIQWLLDRRLVELIFGENIHVQLVKRAGDILRFMALHGALTDEHVALIWDATQGKHESVSHAIYSVIVELALQLSAPQLAMIEARIRAIPLEDFDKHLILLLRGFSHNALSSHANQQVPMEERRWYGLDLLWTLAQDSSPLPLELRQLAYTYTADLVTWQACHTQRGAFLDACMANLRAGTSVIQALSLTIKILLTFPPLAKARKKTESVSHVIDSLDERHDMLANFITELCAFHGRAPPPSEPLDGPAWRSHLGLIQERFDFLDFVLTNASTLELSVDQLDVLFSCLVLNARCADEADIFFRWLEGASQQEGAVSADVRQHAFQRALPKLAPFERLSSAGYSMFELLFLLENRRASRITGDRITLMERAKPGGLSAGFDFEVVAPQLLGEDMLWQIALRSEDEAVGMRAVACLNRLHHRLSAERLGADAEAKRAGYVTMCVDALSEAARALGSRHEGSAVGEASARTENRRILRCLALLHSFVDEPATAHADASKLPRRHGTCMRGPRLHIGVQVISGNPPRHDLDMYANETIHSLRTRVWHLLGAERCVQDPSMLRMITAGKELKNNHATLADLHFQHNQVVHVMKRAPAPPAPPVPTTPAGHEAAGASASRAPPAGLTMDVDAASPAAENAAQAPAMTPACLLVATAANFDALFRLLALEDEVSSRTWQLLMNLPTDSRMVDGLHAIADAPLDNGEMQDGSGAAVPTNWQALLDPTSSFKLLYALQVVDMLIFCEGGSPPAHAGGGFADEGSAGRSAWCAAFTAHGGVSHFIHILTSYNTALLDKARGPQRTACLALLLNLLLQVATQQAPHALLQGPRGAAPGAAQAATCVLDLNHDPASRAAQEECFRCGLGDAMLKFVRHIASDTASPSMRAHEGDATGSDASDDGVLADPRNESETEIVSCAMRMFVALAVAGAQVEDARLRPALCAFESDAPQRIIAGLVDECLCRCEVVAVRSEVALGLCALAEAPCAAAGPGDGETRRPFLAPVAKALASFMRRMSLAPALQVTQYFRALDNVVLAACVAESGLNAADVEHLFSSVVERIRALPIVEARHPVEEDRVLIGLLHVLATIVSTHPAYKRREGLVRQLFEDLFTIPDARAAAGTHPPPRCKTPACREAALTTLIELARDCPQNMAELTDLMIPQHFGGSRRAQWHYMPAVLEKSRTGYVGLKNLGATCYMNSLLQQFHLVPDFHDAMLNLRLVDEQASAPVADDSGGPRGTQDDECLSVLSQIQTLFCYLEASEKRFYDTAELCATYKDYEGQPVNTSQQMDVDEFLTVLFDKLESALKPTPHATLLKKLFGGEHAHQVIGKSDGCTHTSERTESFFALQLDVKSKRSVLEGLNAYVEGEMLEGDNKYYCEQCGKKVDALKRCCVGKLPQNLIVHLKRFDFDYDLMKKIKVNDLCEVPMTIDMWPFTKEGRAELDAAPSSEEDGSDAEFESEAHGAASAAAPAGAPKADAQNHPGCLYDLKGVLVHTGTADSGHYYSYIKERRPLPGSSTPRWFHFNDTHVEEFNPEHIPRCTYGGLEPVTQWDPVQNKHVQRWQQKSHSAYMLFYERRGQEAESADEEPHAEPAQPSEAQHPAQMPAHIYDAVWSENTQFFHDRNVFDEAYFAFTWDVCRMMLEKQLESSPAAAATANGGDGAPAEVQPRPFSRQASGEGGDLVQRALELGTRFFVETLAHAKDKRSVPGWVELLQHGYSKSVESCKWLMNQLAHETTWLRQLLLNCTIAEMRASFATLILHVAICLRPDELPAYPAALQAALQGRSAMDDVHPNQMELHLGAGDIPDDCPLVLASVSRMLALVRDAHVHWRNFQQFFEVLHEMASFGADERQWMLSHRAVELLVDFYTSDDTSTNGGDQQHRQKKSKMGDKFALPNLSPMVEVVSKLVRSCPPREASANEVDGGWAEAVAVGNAYVDDVTAPLSMPSSDRALVTTSHFIPKLIKENCNLEAVQLIIRFYSWQDPGFMTQVVAWLCAGINAADGEMLKPYFEVLDRMLEMDDGLERERVDVAMSSIIRTMCDNLRYRPATITCFKYLGQLCAHHRIVREWVLQHPETIIMDWLVFRNNADYVRHGSFHVIQQMISAIPDEPAVPVPADAPSGALSHAEMHMQATATAISSILVQMAPRVVSLARDLPAPSPRTSQGRGMPGDDLRAHTATFSMYPHALHLCASTRASAVTSQVQGIFPELWELFEIIDSLRVEADEAKKEILKLWSACQCASLLSESSRFARLLDMAVVVRPIPDYVQYNSETLLYYYHVIQTVVFYFPDLVPMVADHNNLDWAVSQLLVESGDYAVELQGVVLDLATRCWAVSQPFRRRCIKKVLDRGRLGMSPDSAHTRLLAVLGKCMVTAEEQTLVLELGGIQQLTAVLKRAAGDDRASGVHARFILVPFALACERLVSCMQAGSDIESILKTWNVGCIPNILFNILNLDVAVNRDVHSLCYRVGIAIANLDVEFVHRMLTVLLQQHESGWAVSQIFSHEGVTLAPLTGSFSPTSRSIARHHLAYLRPEDARRLVSSSEHANDVGAWYNFELEVCVVAFRQLGEEEETMRRAVRLVTCLFLETAPLPAAHAALCRVVHQLRANSAPHVKSALEADMEVLVLGVLQILLEHPACLRPEHPDVSQVHAELLASASSSNVIDTQMLRVTEALQQACSAAPDDPASAEDSRRALALLTSTNKAQAPPVAPGALNQPGAHPEPAEGMLVDGEDAPAARGDDAQGTVSDASLPLATDASEAERANTGRTPVAGDVEAEQRFADAGQLGQHGDAS